jgi:hypothetical protein
MSSPFHFSFQSASASTGGGGDVPSYSARVDFVSDSLLYRGEALPGASESAPLWRVRRIELGADGDVVEKWAGGSAEFMFRWSDRLTLEYV